MAFQPVPQTAEAVVRYTQNQQPCTLTFYGRFGTSYDQTAIDALAAAMDAWAFDELTPVLSNQSTYNSVEVRGLNDPIDLFASNSDGAGGGTLSGTPMPNASAFCVKRVTGFTGRSARGRVYMPITTNMLSSNEDFLNTGDADLFVDALNEVRTYMNGASWTEVVVSRYSGGAKRMTGVTITITGYEYADTEVDSQRRRMPSR